MDGTGSTGLAAALYPLIGESNESHVLRCLCRASFVDFVREFWSEVPGAGRLVWGRHIGVMCSELQTAAERVFSGLPRLYDLVFNVPFGTSKSTVCSILFQPWVWTRMPEARFIFATHTDGLVADLSFKSQAVVRSDKYKSLFPEVRLKRLALEAWGNTAGGERRSCTVGGVTPTGFHAHFLGIDDALDPQGARSEAELETASRFVTEVIPSRKVDKLTALTFCVMQRLHPRDPTHVFLSGAGKGGAVPVRHICLPGELTPKVHPPELAGIYVDGMLDPVRLPRVVLADYRAKLGRLGYAAQVLQDPESPGDGLFRSGYFSRRVRAAPYESKRIRFWDRAATANGGCATAGVLLAVDGGGVYYVEDVVHGHWEPRERNERIKATALKDRSRYGRHEPIIYIEAETGSTGKESFQNIASQLAGFRVREDRPTGSKDVRAEPWSDQLAAGNVRLVDGGEHEGRGKAAWDVAGYVDEHVAFRPSPGKRVGGLVDRVDASSGAFNLLSGRKGMPPMRVLRLSGKGRGGVYLVACDFESLAGLQVEERALLVVVREPSPAGEGVVCSESGELRMPGAESGVYPSSCELPTQPNVNGGSANGVSDPLPPHALDRLAGSLTLRFAPLDPAVCQEGWGSPVEPYGLPAADLLFRPESHGKRLWAFLTRPRPEPFGAVVFVDGGEGSALSLAHAVADVWRLPRSAVLVPGDDDGDRSGPPPVPYVHAAAREARSLVST